MYRQGQENDKERRTGKGATRGLLSWKDGMGKRQEKGERTGEMPAVGSVILGREGGSGEIVEGKERNGKLQSKCVATEHRGSWRIDLERGKPTSKSPEKWVTDGSR